MRLRLQPSKLSDLPVFSSTWRSKRYAVGRNARRVVAVISGHSVRFFPFSLSTSVVTRFAGRQNGSGSLYLAIDVIHRSNGSQRLSGLSGNVATQKEKRTTSSIANLMGERT